MLVKKSIIILLLFISTMLWSANLKRLQGYYCNYSGSSYGSVIRKVYFNGNGSYKYGNSTYSNGDSGTYYGNNSGNSADGVYTINGNTIIVKSYEDNSIYKAKVSNQNSNGFITEFIYDGRTYASEKIAPELCN